jgi:lipoate---protein ligase
VNTPVLTLPGSVRKNDDLFLAGAQQSLPFVHVYEQEDVEVVHGPSCRAENEIDVARCREESVAIVARRGGGGTVVLSPGMVVVVVVGSRPAGDIRAVFRYVQDAVMSCLSKSLPQSIERAGISDLAVGGKKVAGSSLYLPRRPPLFCYQASIMVTSDTSLIQRYLHHPPREPDYRNGRSHDEFCTTLRDKGCELSPADVHSILQERLATALRVS